MGILLIISTIIIIFITFLIYKVTIPYFKLKKLKSQYKE